MKELLSKWAALEKGRCRESDPGTYDVIVGGEFDAILGGAWESVREPDEGWAARSAAFQNALLQAAVQEAIEAREWFWSIEFDPNVKPTTYRAIADNFSEPYEWIVPSEAASPAEALLDAYLTALEAE